MNRRESIIRDTAYYLPGNFLGQAISLIRGIVVRWALGPLSYGWLNIFTLLERYAGYTDFGLINAMDREVPLYRGRSDNFKEQEVEDNVFTSILFSSLVISAGILIYGLFSRSRPFSDFGLTLKTFALFLILYRMVTFFSIFLRTHRKFELLSKLNVLRGAVALVFIVYLAKRHLLAGIFGAEIISLLFFIFLAIKSLSHPFHLAFNPAVIKRLFSIGFPLLLLSLTAMTIRNLDRFMIITYLHEPLLLGYYSAGLLFSNSLVQIPDTISVILFPRLLEDFGGGRGLGHIKKYVEEPTTILAYLMAILIALTFLVSPVFLRYVLPQYESGLKPLQVLLVGTFFISLVNMSGHFLITINKTHYLLLIGGGVILVGILLGFLFIKLGWGLIGIALATTLAYFIYNTLTVGYAYRFWQKSNRALISFYLKIYFPFFYFTPWLLVLSRIGRLRGPWPIDLAVTLVRVAGLAIISLPILFYLEKRYAIFRGLRKVLWPG